ncbi:MAG TPA: isoprenylcysteine carboxylmethyltransferase family protein [Thermoanaerobaculia bacterium]|jgi:protein-S-isoprenylcysteine O-methyltransferase Ste14|nr:isoprenylcysteine carboxylmethyltransferase family protein [Thermoanaerobaculia bacterium]
MDTDTPAGNEKPAPERPVKMVKLGGLTLTGPWACVVLLVLLGSIAALLVYVKPSLRMLLSAALWILFIVYWSVAARNAASAKSSESQASRKRHQLLLNGSLLLLFLPVPGLRQRYLPDASFLVPLGLALQAGSLLLAVWARRHLGRNWSGAVTIKEDHELVRSGPYRLIRHPIYSAMFGMYLGTAVVSGEIHALLALAIVTVAYWRKIRLEEQTLREAFGTNYDDYRRGTWALIPGVF